MRTRRKTVLEPFSTVGDTPLIELRWTEAAQGRLLAKLEMHNPAGSVKDRVVVALIDDAERRGLLTGRPSS